MRNLGDGQEDGLFYSAVKQSVSNAGSVGSIPGLGRSPGEGNGKPLQDFVLGGQRSPAGYSPRGRRVGHHLVSNNNTNPLVIPVESFQISYARNTPLPRLCSFDELLLKVPSAA